MLMMNCTATLASVVDVVRLSTHAVTQSAWHSRGGGARLSDERGICLPVRTSWWAEGACEHESVRAMLRPH
jgi:hypothetical protein